MNPRRAVTATPATTGQAAGGTVTSNLTHGSLFFEDAHGDPVRLAWTPAAEAQPDSQRPRALPPGTYTLTGYRIVRPDEAGTVWHLSTTSLHGIRKVDVQAGATTHITIDPAIHLKTNGRIPANGPNAGRFAVTAAVLSPYKTGLSIYRDGRRVPLHYTITSPSRDAPLESGKLDYG